MGKGLCRKEPDKSGEEVWVGGTGEAGDEVCERCEGQSEENTGKGGGGTSSLGDAARIDLTEYGRSMVTVGGIHCENAAEVGGGVRGSGSDEGDGDSAVTMGGMGNSCEELRP